MAGSRGADTVESLPLVSLLSCVGFTPGLVLLARHRACLLAVQAGTLAELELDFSAAQPQPSGPPWTQRAPRESWWQGGPSGLVMRLPVEPGCGLLMLEPRWVRAGVRTSRKGDWMLAAPSDSSSADTVLSARAAGAGPGPEPLAILLRTATVRPSGTWHCTGRNPTVRTGMRAAHSQRQVALTGRVRPGEAQPCG